MLPARYCLHRRVAARRLYKICRRNIRLMLIENGKPYPDPRFRNNEGATIITNSALFDVLILIPGITGKEEKAFKTGTLRYGVFVQDDIPFLLLDFPDAGLTLDASYNFHKVDPQHQLEWLAAEGNAVHIVAAEQRTYHVKAQRFVGLDLAVPAAIKAAAARQLASHPNMQSVDMGIQKITARFTTEMMMKQAKMYRL